MLQIDIVSIILLFRIICDSLHVKIFTCYNESVNNPLTLLGGIKMFNDFLFEFKNWWFGEAYPGIEMTEFERVESKHTRIHHDEDIFEEIRVH